MTPGTVACQAPLSMEFSRREGDLPYPGVKPRSPGLQADSLPSDPIHQEAHFAMLFSRRSSQPGDGTRISYVSALAGGLFNPSTTSKVLMSEVSSSSFKKSKVSWERYLFCFPLGLLGFLSRDRSSSVLYLCIACFVLTLTEMLSG